MSAEKKSTSGKAPAKARTPGKKARNEKHIIAFLFAVCLLLSVFLGSMLFALKSLDIPDLRTIANYQPRQASEIYDRRGQVVARVFAENRTVIPLSQMNPLLPKAFVAAEDGRFYEHSGLDPISIARALINNILAGRRGQGGSTITQQVARALLLTPEKTYIRKFKEAILAWRIDTLLSKEEILYVYLNQIYLGSGAYGVEAASQVYFGKHASQITLGEAAILAGLPQAPSKYSPITHLERAVARQRYVLNRMAADGYITSEMARTAFGDEPRVRDSKRSFDPINGYYLDAVRRQAEERLGKSLEEAGARIHTYLDQRLQTEAMGAVDRGTRAVRARNGGYTPQGALVCLDRKSAQVLALAGGTDYMASPFNRAIQARRPAGSTFKPFVYGAALMRGWQPNSTISDAPFTMAGGRSGVWQPKNYSGVYHGDTTLEMALANSYNAASVRLMQKVGVKPVHQVAQAAGITAPMPRDLSLALGTVDVSLLELTAAYGPFVGDGRFVSPQLIDRIEVGSTRLAGGGGVAGRRVFEAAVARSMRAMLHKVVTDGTGHRAKGLPGTTGGKTGTSDDNRDAWFIGYNGNYITGVWIGHDRNQPLGKQENGGRTAVPVWRDFMGRIGG